jgi:hypothetical protein
MNLLPSNGRCLQCHYLATCLRATIYCHVSRIVVTNNNGFWIWWLDLLDAFFKIRTNYDSSQSVTGHASVPYWTTSVCSSAVTNDQLLLTHWTPWTTSVWRILYEESLTDSLRGIWLPWIHKWTPFYNFQADRLEVAMSNISSVLLCCYGNAVVNIRYRGNMCLPSRCLAKCHIPSQY